jgi:pyruvate dehydrogenase E2 component (dihydrolipoamide acetyltransferase)
MPTQILMPALSPTMEEGTLAKWLVKEGDKVASGDLLAEIETDKATMEFEAVDEGVIGKILVPAGTEGVKVNSPIAVLLAEGEGAADAGSAEAPKASDAAAKAAPGGSSAVARSPCSRNRPHRRLWRRRDGSHARPVPGGGRPCLRLPPCPPHREGEGPRPRRHQGLGAQGPRS